MICHKSTRIGNRKLRDQSLRKLRDTKNKSFFFFEQTKNKS